MSNSNQSYQDLEDLKANWEQSEQKLFNDLDKDEFAEQSNTKAGTPEYKAQKELTEEAVKINSTNRVNLTIKILKTLGWVGLLVGFVVKLISLVFDLQFHLPDLVAQIGDFWSGIFGGFMVFMIMLLFHIAGMGLLNNKWEKTPKLIMIVLFVATLIASLYIDYRAIDNYSSKTVEAHKNEKLNSTNTKEGSRNNLIASKNDITNSNIKSLTAQKESISKSIETNNNMINKVNESIEQVKAQKLHITSRKRIAQLNQNVYTSRKQLEQLENTNKSLFLEAKEIDKNLALEVKKLDSIEQDKQHLLSVSDVEAMSEKSKRVGFFIALILLVELISNFGLLAEFLNVKNIKKSELIQLIEEQQTHKDIMGAVRHTMNQNIANDIRQFSKEGEYYNTISKMQSLQRLSQMNNQVETTKQNIKMLGRVGDIVRETDKEAIEGVQHQLNAIRAGRENAKLRLLLDEALRKG